MTAPAVLRRHADLLSNSGSLMASSLVTSSLGFVFWWVAARVAPVETVGAASAAVSALTLIGTAGMFGLGTLLIAELPRMGTGRGRLISACLLAAGTVSAAGGLLYVLVGPAVSSGLRHSVGSPLAAWNWLRSNGTAAPDPAVWRTPDVCAPIGKRVHRLASQCFANRRQRRFRPETVFRARPPPRTIRPRPRRSAAPARHAV